LKFPKFLLVLGIMAVLISSCQSQSVIVTSPTEVPLSITLAIATEIPTIVANKTVPMKVPANVSPKNCASSNGQLPSLFNSETPSIRPVNNSLGGGVVQTKEFTIELLLYCDSVYQPDSADFISDIGSLAIYYNWRYDAPYESGLIYGYFGIEPELRWQSGEGPTASQGHVSQGKSTGIRFAPNTFPDFSKPTSLRFIYIIQIESGQLSGAVLSFDIQRISDGLQPTNILVKPISDAELKSMESIKSQIPTVTA